MNRQQVRQLINCLPAIERQPMIIKMVQNCTSQDDVQELAPLVQDQVMCQDVLRHLKKPIR